MGKRTVLIPLDGSDFSRQVLPHVRRFCPPENHRLLLLQVANPKRDFGDVIMPPVSGEEFGYDRTDRVLAEVDRALEAVADELRHHGYTVTTEIRLGKPRDEILTAVENQDIDLVALATHGRTGVSRLALGSVAEHLIRHLSAPLLLVRPFERPAESNEADEDAQTE